MASKQSFEELQAEIEALKSQLVDANEQKTAAEDMAKAMASASQFTGGTSQEQPTGRTIMVNVCLNPTVRDEKKLKYKEVEEPTYYYNIDLPAGAGLCLYTNGVEYYHGQTYEFDQATLAEMKSRVAQCWYHEKSIHGENENAYRRKTEGKGGMNGMMFGR